MTAMQEAPAIVSEPLFTSPWGGLLDFQAEGVTQCYYDTGPEAGDDGGMFLLFDAGLGKTASSIAMACLLIEDEEVDRVIVACEKGKLSDWIEDVERFSGLTVCKYHGPNRDARVAKTQPQVIVSTYETLGAGLMSWQKNEGKRGRGSRVDGPLMQGWSLRNSRTLWIMDEVAKLRGRSSNVHKSFDYALTQARKVTHQRVLGLTATPVERDFEDFYNLGRILVPSLMPTVTDFEKRFTRGVDMLGRYVFRRDKGPEFASLFTPVIVRKRKTDPDVIDQFPKLTEETITVDMHPEHRKFCHAVEDLFSDDPDNPVAFTILRMSAGHPASHLHAANPISQTIVETLGEEFLRSVPASKSVELIKRLTPLVKGQGAQVIVFSFYGQSVLVELEKDLLTAGFTVSKFVGGMTTTEQDRAKKDFTSGATEIFLASDSGAQGLNLGNASYVIEYDSALTYSKRLQRYNRASRLSSTVSTVTAWTMVLQESIEVPIMEGVLRRNKDLDVATGDQADDTAFISADERKTMIAGLLRRAKR